MSSETDMTGDDEVTVAEYVLHLLAPSERAEFERRLDVDGALRARLAWWSEALVDLAGEYPDVAPPPGVRARLATAIAPARAEPAQRRWGLSPWRWLGGAALALAVVLLLVLQLPQVRMPDTAPSFVAEIVAEDRTFAMNAAFRPESGELALTRLAGETPAGRVLELWAIARGASGPVSLGVLPDGDTATVTVPEALRDILPGSTLAVSDEPPGGSPTGAPTGAVLGTGGLTAI